MQRYVLIDANSGFVWGDAVAETPIEACRAVDAQCGEHDRGYEDIGRVAFNGRSGYFVFRAPADMHLARDGQDAAFIAAVEGLPIATHVAIAARWWD